MLTDDNLLLERPHDEFLGGGAQRIYDFGNGNGLSVVNAPGLHSYPFAWEVAVLEGLHLVGGFPHFVLTYDTPLTKDVEVFDTDEEANAFIARAKAYFKGE